MQILSKSFDELSPTELYAILKVRSEVFVVEQTCIYLDPDGKDEVSLHVYLEEDGEIIAYMRVLPPGVWYEELALGRVLTTRRGEGLGEKLVHAGIQAGFDAFGKGPIRIDAQTYTKGFYEKFGFIQVSDEYDEDGIPHIQMLLEVK